MNYGYYESLSRLYVIANNHKILELNDQIYQHI